MLPTVRWSTLMPLLFAGIVIVAPEARAQTCVGIPIGPGQNAAEISIGFPTGATIFGAAFHHNMAANPLTLTGNFQHMSPEGGGDGQNSFGGGATFELDVAAFPPELSFCPTGEIMYSSVGDLNRFTVPLGVRFGTAVPLGEDGAITLLPWGGPSIIFDRLSGGNGSDTSTDLDIFLGANASFGTFYTGLDLRNIFRTGSAFVTVKGGMTF